MLSGHSNELILLFAGSALLVGLHGYWHARQYWEGLPPILDAFVSMAGYAVIVGVFVWAGRVGGEYGHPHAARVLAVAVTFVMFRAVRTWIGKEQVRYRQVRAPDSAEDAK